MEAKNSLTVNNVGQPILNSEQMIEVILRGNSIDYLACTDSDDIELYKKFQNELLDNPTIFVEKTQDSSDITEYHKTNSNLWIFPDKYKNIDLYKFLINKCSSLDERARVELELKMFEDRGLIPLLHFFIFFVDYMRTNGYVWGVGRGSSVSSFILYLIGIHKINSMKYELEITDYLK
jgi:DNA polymerase III alpha subunit